jgi:predicted TIM-barrel fold metal-dependent hydrolase
MKDYDAAGFRPEVKQLILKENALKALGLSAAA